MFFLVILLMLISLVSLYKIMRSSDLSFKDLLLMWSSPNYIYYKHIKGIYPSIEYNSFEDNDVVFIVKKVRELENAIIQRHKTIFSVNWDDLFEQLSLFNKYQESILKEKSNTDILKLKQEVELLKKHLWDMIVNIYSTSFINPSIGKRLYDDLIRTAEKYDEFQNYIKGFDIKYEGVFKWLKLDPLLTKD